MSRAPIALAALGPEAEAAPWACARVSGLRGSMIEAKGAQVGLGALARLGSPKGPRARVAAFEGETLYLAPTESGPNPARPGAWVFFDRQQQEGARLPIGPALMGRAVDAEGMPLDGLGPVEAPLASIENDPINPLARAPVETLLDCGVKAINTMIPMGVGQRLGIFAGSGVGKSTLLSMLCQHTRADAVVIGLVGERAREAQEFLRQAFASFGKERVTLVVCTAEASPWLKMQAAEYACAISQWHQREGRRCLLLLDSLTRYAMAARELGLSVGERPAMKGYPPSAFAKVNSLVERAGNGPEGGGSISAFYTVLAEGDDLQDPVADTARAILDGHIVLSRELADSGVYPPIDIGASVSRAASALWTPEQSRLAREAKALWSAREKSKDLVAVGAYARGTDPVLDKALERAEPIFNHIRQEPGAACDSAASWASLAQAVGGA